MGYERAPAGYDEKSPRLFRDAVLRELTAILNWRIEELEYHVE